MNEYYCPNCDAVLNDQPGFDPDVGIWTCTACGKHLMDDDVYDGDTYEGIAWYCDECDALLNRQPGFSDCYGIWTCTECGHVNGTTEDDIYESEEDYQYQKTVNAAGDFVGSVVSGMISGIASASSEDDVADDNEDEDSYLCPICNDVLNEQLCYDEYAEKWTCTCCGTKLHHNYVYDEYEIDHGSENEELSCSVSGADVESECSQYAKNTNVKKKQRKKDMSWIAIVLCFIIALGIPFGILLKFEIEEKIAISEGKINAGYYKDLIGEDYKTVEAHFYSAGFTDVELIDLDDAGILFWKDGKVETISVAGNNTFESTDWFEPDAKVVISYH